MNRLLSTCALLLSLAFLCGCSGDSSHTGAHIPAAPSLSSEDLESLERAIDLELEVLERYAELRESSPEDDALAVQTLARWLQGHSEIREVSVGSELDRITYLTREGFRFMIESPNLRDEDVTQSSPLTPEELNALEMVRQRLTTSEANLAASEDPDATSNTLEGDLLGDASSQPTASAQVSAAAQGLLEDESDRVRLDRRVLLFLGSPDQDIVNVPNAPATGVASIIKTLQNEHVDYDLIAWNDPATAFERLAHLDDYGLFVSRSHGWFQYHREFDTGPQYLNAFARLIPSEVESRYVGSDQSSELNPDGSLTNHYPDWIQHVPQDRDNYLAFAKETWSELARYTSVDAARSSLIFTYRKPSKIALRKWEVGLVTHIVPEYHHVAKLTTQAFAHLLARNGSPQDLSHTAVVLMNCASAGRRDTDYASPPQQVNGFKDVFFSANTPAFYGNSGLSSAQPNSRLVRDLLLHTLESGHTELQAFERFGGPSFREVDSIDVPRDQAATAVHHVVPVEGGGTFEYDQLRFPRGGNPELHAYFGTEVEVRVDAGAAQPSRIRVTASDDHVFNMDTDPNRVDSDDPTTATLDVPYTTVTFEVEAFGPLGLIGHGLHTVEITDPNQVVDVDLGITLLDQPERACQILPDDLTRQVGSTVTVTNVSDTPSTVTPNPDDPLHPFGTAPFTLQPRETQAFPLTPDHQGTHTYTWDGLQASLTVTEAPPAVGRILFQRPFKNGSDYGLTEVDLETGQQTRLPLSTGAQQPAWSRDGTRLATIGLDGYLHLAAADANADRLLVQPIYPDESHYLPTWSPDGSQIAFLRSNADRGREDDDTTWEIVVLTVASGATTIRYSGSRAAGDKSIAGLAWTDRGLMTSRYDSASENVKLMFVSATGTFSLVPGTEGPFDDLNPRVGLDGTVVFRRTDDRRKLGDQDNPTYLDEALFLWKNGQLTRATTWENFAPPYYGVSPDGNYVAFQFFVTIGIDRYEPHHLYVTTPGGTPTPLLDNRSDTLAPPGGTDVFAWR